MNYKTFTLLIFVVLMMLVSFLIFSETKWGLLIIGLVVPCLVVFQTWIVLTAKEEKGRSYEDGVYEKD
ncbi:MAG: hypothetical protein R2830_06745 [Saprospiraceae bacterium]